MTAPRHHAATVPPVVEQAVALYERPGGSVGCCLHVVLSDGNLETDMLRFCFDRSVETSHADCKELAQNMLLMTRSQRKRVHDRLHARLRENFADGMLKESP